MAAEFSTSAEDAISRVIQINRDEEADCLSDEQFEDFYEIKRTADEIINGGYKRIALQFPDELLHDSVPIYRKLKAKIGQPHELYVLADTSYGSCCVDEVAAQHVDADAMIHYGHACLSLTSRLPVIYVFGKKNINVDACVSSLMETFNLTANTDDKPKAILLKHDVVYTHQANAILESLRTALEPRGIPVLYNAILIKSAPEPSQTPIESVSQSSQATPDISLENTSIFYVGGESLRLTNLLMTNASCDVYSYNPHTNSSQLESLRTNKLLMRRYALVQKARDADVFGILVGTLGVATYIPLINHLRRLLSKNRKKSYTISVGKLNPAKLANFLEVECFVLVACPENSMIEAKEFLRPIVTPYELEVALQDEQSWTGKYILDFGKLLKEHSDASDLAPSLDGAGKEKGEEDPDQPIFSLVTGKYRHAKRYGGGNSPQITSNDSSAIIVRNQDNSLAKLEDSAAGQFLQSRTYRGLDIRLGEDAPSLMEQGKSGIARGYQDDHKTE